MIESKLVQKFGNSAHVVLPKEFIGKRIQFIVKTKTFSQIKEELISILTPYLENIIGVYVYGSYARNDQSIESDIDILVITDEKIKITHEDYEIISITEENLIKTLNHDAVLVLPIIKEARPIINPKWLESYKNYKFTKENTKEFMEGCERILEINKGLIERDTGIGATIYSLILRIRGLLMIELMTKNKNYKKSELFSQLERDFSSIQVKELYSIYTKVKNKEITIEKSKIIKKTDLEKLLKVAEELFEKIKKQKWEKRNTKKE